MSRRGVVWLLTLPLAIVGSQLAHNVAYRLTTPNEAGRTHELAASVHSYLTYAPAALGICAVLVVLSLAHELGQLLARRSRPPSRPSALSFALLAPGIFVAQEHFERLFHDGVFPLHVVLELSFLVGLVLQLPFAVAAYVLARLLLRAVRSLGRWLATSARRRLAGHAPSRPATCTFVPRVPALALGYGSRGPPALSR
jgi:hypothetical protein